MYINTYFKDDLHLKIKSFLNEEFPLLIEKVNKSDQLTENLKEATPSYGRNIICLPVSFLNLLFLLYSDHLETTNFINT